MSASTPTVLHHVRPAYVDLDDNSLRLVKADRCAQLDAKNKKMYQAACSKACKAQKLLAGLVDFQLVVEMAPASLLARRSGLANRNAMNPRPSLDPTREIDGYREGSESSFMHTMNLPRYTSTAPPLSPPPSVSTTSLSRPLQTAATAPSSFSGTIAQMYK